MTERLTDPTMCSGKTGSDRLTDPTVCSGKTRSDRVTDPTVCSSKTGNDRPTVPTVCSGKSEVTDLLVRQCVPVKPDVQVQEVTSSLLQLPG